MLNCLIVGIGGFVGAASRYLFTLLPFHRSGAFLLHTLLINLIGSFCIGMLVVTASKTFSTFALETTELFQNGRPALAALYIALSLCLSIGAVLLAEMFAQ